MVVMKIIINFYIMPEPIKEGGEKQEMNAVAKELEAISLADGDKKDAKEKPKVSTEFSKEYYDEKLKIKEGYKEVKPISPDDIAYAEKFFSDSNSGKKMEKGDVTNWEDSDGKTKTKTILCKTSDAPAAYRASSKKE